MRTTQHNTQPITYRLLSAADQRASVSDGGNTTRTSEFTTLSNRVLCFGKGVSAGSQSMPRPSPARCSNCSLELLRVGSCHRTSYKTSPPCDSPPQSPSSRNRTPAARSSARRSAEPFTYKSVDIQPSIPRIFPPLLDHRGPPRDGAPTHPRSGLGRDRGTLTGGQAPCPTHSPRAEHAMTSPS